MLGESLVETELIRKTAKENKHEQGGRNPEKAVQRR